MKNLTNVLIIIAVFAVMVAAQVQFNAPWNLDRIDQRTGFDGIYNYQATGAGVRVYVVDSGIELSNPEFDGRASNGTGRFTTKCSTHGTEVAAVIGGRRYGVAKDVDLVSVQVLCSHSPTASDVIKGLNWVARDMRHTSAPVVVNISLDGDYSLQLNSAVQSLIDAGAIVVVAAGNEAIDACYESPSAVVDAIVVGGTRSDDSFLPYSNFGPCVDINAPGEGVGTVSTGGVDTFASGTSFAAPHVAGLAALYLEQHPNATPAEVRDAIVANATPDVLSGANPNLFIDTLF